VQKCSRQFIDSYTSAQGYRDDIKQQCLRQGGRIPALAVTAFARVEDRTAALRAGFNLHLAKPIEPNELVAAIANLVGRVESKSTA
jgi:CheY-like chemotaxis protein